MEQRPQSAPRCGVIWSACQRAKPASQRRPCLFRIGDTWALLNPAGLIRHDRGICTNSSLRPGQDASKRVRCGGAMQVPDPRPAVVMVEQPQARHSSGKARVPPPPSLRSSRQAPVMTGHCAAYQIWSRSGPFVRARVPMVRWARTDDAEAMAGYSRREVRGASATYGDARGLDLGPPSCAGSALDTPHTVSQQICQPSRAFQGQRHVVSDTPEPCSAARR